MSAGFTYDVVHLKKHPNAEQHGIAIDHIGYVRHAPGSVTATDIRNHHILHYVVSGKGIFCCEGREVPLQAGDLYLFPKNCVVSYRTDGNEPWVIYYVGFYGEQDDYFINLLGLSKQNITIHNVPPDPLLSYFKNMLEAARATDASMTSLIGWFYLIVGELLRYCSVKNDAIEPLDLFHTMANYIQNNLSHPLRIGSIASVFHISQSQMFRIFRDACGLSPQQYYEKVRINYACTLIYQSNLSYKEISQLCGYEYESHFYKSFKKIMNTTPAEYRKKRVLYKDQKNAQ